MPQKVAAGSFRWFLPWFLLAWLIAVVPLFLFHSVPGVDTPNHLARLHVLATLSDRPTLQEFYRINFVVLPNLAIDLLITPVLMLTKVNAMLLMKIFIANLIGLSGFGFAWINREITGKWSAYGLFGLAFAYNYILGFGFINYLFGLSLGLISFALCLRLDTKPLWQNLALVLLCPLIALNHLMAFALFAISFVAHGFFKPNHRFQGWSGLVAGTSLVLVLIRLSPVSERAPVYWRPFSEHLVRLASPLVIGKPMLDYAFQILLLALIGYGVYRKSFRVPTEAKVTGIAFLLIALFAPHQAFTSAFIFARIPVWLILIYFALVELPLRRVGVVLAILSLRSLDIGTRFLGMNPEIDQIRADLRQIPDGAMLYQAAGRGSMPLEPEGWNPSLLHASCLVLLDRDVYVNNLFTIPSQQPLNDVPGLGAPFRDRYMRGPFEQMVQKEIADVRARQSRLPDPNLRDRATYLLILKAKSAPAVPANAEIIANRARYTLYRLR